MDDCRNRQVGCKFGAYQLMLDNKKEWLNKSRVDYFANFMMLWLAFNSWYKSHYSELKKNDRTFINKIKTDFSGRNQPYETFCSLISENKTKQKKT